MFRKRKSRVHVSHHCLTKLEGNSATRYSYCMYASHHCLKRLLERSELKSKVTIRTGWHSRDLRVGQRLLCTWNTCRSHPDRIGKSATSKRSNIRGKIYRMDFCAWKKWQGNQLEHCTRTSTTFQVGILRIGIGSSDREREQCFVTSSDNFVREFIVDSRASLHMMSRIDLTPEEQETIRKNKVSVVMTASHTTEEATVHVCYLDMFVQVQ